MDCATTDTPMEPPAISTRLASVPHHGHLGAFLGVEDKTNHSKTHGKGLGKASVTSNCIKFKALKDMDPEALDAADREGVQRQA